MSDGEKLEISWFGQSMFALEGGGLRVVCDPTPPETGYRYDPVPADVVLVTHGHFDHSYLEGVTGGPEVVSAPGGVTVGGLDVVGHASFHDASGGRERGPNVIYTWEQAGFRLAHLGDLGGTPSGEVLEEVTGLDVVMMPVGGVFTIGGGEAARLAALLEPSVVIPMHYGTPACTIPIRPIGEFTSVVSLPVREVVERPLVLTRDQLPASTEVWIVPYQ